MRSIQDISSEVLDWFNPSLDTVYDDCDKNLTTVKASMYSLCCGGKRLRPTFMYVISKMIGANMDDTLIFARSLEMIHTYSLIHDDLPCMDNDDLRRGKPTCHKVYGDNFATLAGDSLLNRAAEHILELVCSKPEYAYAGLNMLRCSGIRGMIGGQDIDISSTGRIIAPELLKELHERKTGALLMTAICTPVFMKDGNKDSELIQLLRKLSNSIGLAFQIKDDLLDVSATTEVLGKTVGKDSRDCKSTYVTIFGVDKASEMMNEEINSAHDVLDELALLGYDTRDLKAVVDYVVLRDR